MTGIESVHDLQALPLLDRLLLTTDGTVTPMLEHITGEPVSITCLTRRSLEEAEAAKLSPLLDGAGPVQLRIVDIVGAHSRRIYVKARSLIVLEAIPAAVRRDLDETNTPVGVLLRAHRVETYRELLDYRLLANEFQREYRILHGGRTALLIKEHFLSECLQAS
ncbi:chorismate--pyruvate lyase family protein [Nocardia asiatica]|uniref:chorismate--pyruvate lyase family protein n=1 Tax=Nocardia asiatica TaxID=209252 RepID=UPI002458DA96|nr:chorismate pyruvate-lyase family protein [Nocardia asiatica]